MQLACKIPEKKANPPSQWPVAGARPASTKFADEPSCLATKQLLLEILCLGKRKCGLYIYQSRVNLKGKFIKKPTTCQSMTRCLFQLSRRDREFLPFSLMLRDEIENFCLHSRETRPRRMLKKMHFCWGMASLFFSPDIKDTRDSNKDSLKYKYITQFPLLDFGSMRPSTACQWKILTNEKFGQDYFLKLLLSLLSKCHFSTGQCVRRVKVKVASFSVP